MPSLSAGVEKEIGLNVLLVSSGERTSVFIKYAMSISDAPQLEQHMIRKNYF